MLLIKSRLIQFFLLALFMTGGYVQAESALLDHTLVKLFPKGEVNLRQAYGGKVLLVVNTASSCGFTPQYEGLETLYQKYKDQGLVVLGFPSNDFRQEKKEGEEIVKFCRYNYGVSFPIFEKSSVTGDKANPFYKDLALSNNGKEPRWNFFKYLIDRNENVVGFYPSVAKPVGGKLEEQIKTLLKN